MRRSRYFGATTAQKRALRLLLRARHDILLLCPHQYPSLTLRRLGDIVQTMETAIELFANAALGVDPDDRAVVDRWVAGLDKE